MLYLQLAAALASAISAAVWSWWAGFSLWSIVGFYVLGGNLGLTAVWCAACLGLVGERSEATPQDA
jgi:hypothetical protein